MNWETYESNYYEIAKIHNKDDSYCIEQLAYAKKLYDSNLPIIYNQEHFCKLVGYSKEYVYSASNSPKKFYRTFFIKKKNGGDREINEPLPSLKEIQEWIYKEILCNIKISPYAKAYVHGKSIKDNAKFHKRQNKVLTIDLKDFFPSICFNKVMKVFFNAGYRKPVAVLLANLCCLDDSLPQGAPTSPCLSNIIASALDDKIVDFVKNKNIRYTRYADDLTLSGDFDEKIVINKIRKIVSSEGYKINPDKTRVRKRNQRQEVTGIVVNEKLQVSRKDRRDFRRVLYYIDKYGLEEHLKYVGNNKNNYIYHLIGKITHASFINPNDERLKVYLEKLRSLI